MRVAYVVGRDPHLQQLERALSGTREGSGGSVFLVGEAGIGKSRLAAEAVGAARGCGMRVLRGRSSTTGPAVPFRPLTEALMPLFRSSEPVDSSVLGPYRSALGRFIPDCDEGDGKAGEREHSSAVVLGEAVLRLVIAADKGGGLLLVLEDLHDADAETLAVVEYLVDNLEHTPVLLLATIRTEICDGWDLACSARHRGVASVIELPPLTRSQVQDMIAAHLGIESGQVPQAAFDRLWDDSAGSPSLVEELLQSMINSGMLVQGDDGWHVVGDLHGATQTGLFRGVLRRIDRLGPQGLTLLSSAAVLGQRFPLTVLHQMTGVNDRDLLSHLHAGVAAQLVAPDESVPDWYAFRHSLTVHALLSQLTPGQRAELAGRAADAVQALHPELPGEWCFVAGEMRFKAGDLTEAGRLFAEAGQRALANGAIGSAVVLLDRAEQLLAGIPDTDRRVRVQELLLSALAEAGDFARAFDLAERLDILGESEISAARLAALHTQLAKLAHAAGRWTDVNRQITRARAVLRSAPDEAALAAVDVTAAYLILDTPGADRTQQAEKLARSALAAAERYNIPTVTCQAWEVLASLARDNDPDSAQAMLEQAHALAERHRLPLRRMYAATRLGGNAWLAEGDTAGLRTAQEDARRLGSATIVHTIDGILMLDSVLRGQFEAGKKAADQCLPVLRRLRLTPSVRYVLMTTATLAAHQGDRAAMESILAEFAEAGGSGSQEESLTFGLARAFCALLEEDREQGMRELQAASKCERDNPSTYHLNGTHHGIRLLLDVLAGTVDRTRYQEIAATSSGRMRWNRQFALLASAVLLGREGQGEEAASTVDAALKEAQLYPTALSLGLRLIADAAHEDGWGDPVAWFRRAEHHFHQQDVPAVANACRAALRSLGVPVHQHRTGTSSVPEQLRTRGVTVREFEVFILLAQHMNNRDIAGRLYISPRTVEKHVASLITKTGETNRAALRAKSASLLPSGDVRDIPQPKVC